jgi:hypothetical protein
VLIKAPEDKSKRLKLLEELQASDRLDEAQKKWLRDQFRRLRPGVKGELDAAYYLNHYFADGKNTALLHDLRIKEGHQVAQIDHLLIDRTFTFYLLETKTFGGDLHINEHGEFSVTYPGERVYGIESPLEQSRRHEVVLRKVLERIGITGRIGTAPIFEHVILIHPKARIHRPAKGKFATDNIIKADQFFTWRDKKLDSNKVTANDLVSMLNFRSRETVIEWGNMLRLEHRPDNQLELPDFMQPKLIPTPPAPAPAPRVSIRTEVAFAQPAPAASSAPAQAACAECGRALTDKVLAYCRDNPELFAGKLYCFTHQAPHKSRTKTPRRPAA